MSVMQRIRDITAATINDRIDQAEDPVRLIDRFLHTQYQQIQQVEQLLEQCIRHNQAMKQQYLNAKQWMEKREQQALLAVKAGEDHLARLALHEKLMHEEKVVQYESLYEQGREQIIELETELTQLKADYQEVYSKRQYYIARMESVKLQQRMNERLSNNATYSGNLFDRLATKLDDMELETRCLTEVRRIGQEVMHYGGRLHQVLEQEMEKLREKLDHKTSGKTSETEVQNKS